jgi:hypothetical protein
MKKGALRFAPAFLFPYLVRRLRLTRLLPALVLLVLAGPAAFSLDWELPVTTLRVETGTGSAEDPEDAEALLPSSLRTTVSLRIREEADPAVFGLTLRGSWKDYFLQSGDYSYVELDQDGSLRVSDAVKLGYDLAAKDMTYPQTDALGRSKDALALKAGLDTAVTLARGTTLDMGLTGRWELAVNDARSLQAYVVSAALSSRIGEWVFGARYRGEFRFALGAGSGVTSSMYNTGAISLAWDPN